MIDSKLPYVGFEPEECGFRAYLVLQGSNKLDGRWDTALITASKLYSRSIASMRLILNRIDSLRANRAIVPAVLVWELGDEVFKLTNSLESVSVQVNGLYDHLVRDLEVKQKWLEKVIILRRYLPNRSHIPSDLPWGRCEKGTRRIAEELMAKRKRK